MMKSAKRGVENFYNPVFRWVLLGNFIKKGLVCPDLSSKTMVIVGNGEKSVVVKRAKCPLFAQKQV